MTGETSGGRPGGELERLGDVLSGVGLEPPPDVAALEAAWPQAVGPETARNTQLRGIKRGRLVVATSSSVWAQTLQMMEADIGERLGELVGPEVVREIVFRPAGWDPGGGASGPKPLGRRGRDADVGGPSVRRREAPRALTTAERQAVSSVRREACDPELGRRIAAAMEAALSRGERG